MSRTLGTQEGSTKQAATVPLSAACFVMATAGLAVMVLLASWHNHRVADVPAFGLMVVAALLCGSRAIRVSEVATISVGFVAVFATLLHVGIPEACVVGAVSGLAGCLLSPGRHPRSPFVPLFAVASIVVAAGMAAGVFGWAGGRPGATEWYALGAPAALAAITYHLANCLLVAAVAGLSPGGRAGAVFRYHLNQCALAYYGGAGWSMLVHLARQLSGPWALVAAAPPLYSLHVVLKRWGWARADR